MLRDYFIVISSIHPISWAILSILKCGNSQTLYYFYSHFEIIVIIVMLVIMITIVHFQKVCIHGLITLWKITPYDARNSQNCFGSKKHSMTLHQVKTGKHECRNVRATFWHSCFRLTKGRAMFLWPKTIVVSFLHHMVLFFKMLLNRSSKRQFLVLHCRTNIKCLLLIFKNAISSLQYIVISRY